MAHHIFCTTIGKMVISWEDDKITRIHLPTRGLKIANDKPPQWLKKVIREIQHHLQGKYSEFHDLPLDFSQVTEFQRLVLEGCRKIEVGMTLSYGELAESIGKPKAARAVGSALGKNPFPVVVPCHRVLASGRKIGGFSAEGEICTKYRLLQIEKVSAVQVHSQILAWEQGQKSLEKADKVLKKAIRKIGTFHLENSSARSVFESLAKSIVYQQLAGAAAHSIWQRFCQLFPRQMPMAKSTVKMTDEKLRGAGLSRNKMLAIRDLAEKTISGEIISDLRVIKTMTDEQIIENLTFVRGIGRWTVQMLLIFYLQRLDVFPEDDYGIRKGFAELYGLEELPKPREMRKSAEKWYPYRTIASWYLWRVADGNE